jgi:NADPH-dependent glutamate synthase beta subunit-like oxidoreductase
VSGIELCRCTAVFDAAGAFAPTFSEERRTEEADHVILAIGQRADLSFCAGLGDVELKGDLIAVNPETGATNVTGVFAAGEIATGPGMLVDAIADAKRVAAAIDRHFGGDGVLEPAWAERADTSGYDGRREPGFSERPRAQASELPLDERHVGFAEVRLCLDPDAASAEARRCLQCDLEQCPEEILARAQQRDGDS